jgi:hypothetical protein
MYSQSCTVLRAPTRCRSIPGPPDHKATRCYAEGLICFLFQENSGLVAPWIIGFITVMAVEAVATVYSNVLRDHVNKVRHVNLSSCLTLSCHPRHGLRNWRRLGFPPPPPSNFSIHCFCPSPQTQSQPRTVSMLSLH